MSDDADADVVAVADPDKGIVARLQRIESKLDALTEAATRIMVESGSAHVGPGGWLVDTPDVIAKCGAELGAEGER